MTQDQLQYFRDLLEAHQAELVATLEEATDATATVALDTSIGRLSRIDAIQSQQMALGLKARQQQTLQRVRTALAAFRDGSYGRCRRCKHPIALERLEAQPDAVLCVACATTRRL